MPTNSSETVLFPIDLGSVDNYDLSTLSLARYTGKGSLHTGHLFLRATLKEMRKIQELSKDLECAHDLHDTKFKYDDLMTRKEMLEQEPKTFNPFKLFELYNAKRKFVARGRKLYIATRTTSEKLERDLLSVDSADVPPAEGESIAKNERIAGISVDMGGALTEATRAFFQDTTNILVSSLDPSADPSPSDGGDGQSSTTETTTDPVETLSSARRSSVSSPTSPRSASIIITNFHYHNYNNSVPNPNSTAPGFTVNIHSSDHDGSVHNHVSPPDPLP
ncbi:hypothetical protein PAXINDRAFT_167050 [Paxillus involutus ATCC 200175]|nr:hypothetical protein PAXINDRAFT_167050 [Paxillus involutus ATCC 200175]